MPEEYSCDVIEQHNELHDFQHSEVLEKGRQELVHDAGDEGCIAVEANHKPREPLLLVNLLEDRLQQQETQHEHTPGQEQRQVGAPLCIVKHEQV